MSTALLIVDMQNDFVQEGAPARVAGALATVPHVVELLAAARAADWLVVHVVREYAADASNVELPRRNSFRSNAGRCPGQHRRLTQRGHCLPSRRGADPQRYV